MSEIRGKVKCKYCGGELDNTFTHLTKPDECFTCWHWRGHLENDKDKNKGIFAIINGHHYIIGDENASKLWRGFDGHKFIIEFFDGRVIETTNLWHQGEIMPYWRQFMLDNASFAKREKWIKTLAVSCMSKEVK